MIQFKNKQTSLFDFVTGPIFERVHDPELENLKKLIESENLLEAFYNELIKHEKKVFDFGRPTHPMDVVIRMLILRRLYKWSYRTTEKMGNDSISVRKFLGLKEEAAPDHSILSRWNKRIPESLWKKLNETIVKAAKKKKVTLGNKMRTDTTVVEGNIHYPTDSHLLFDGIQKLGRLSRKVRSLGLVSGEIVRDFSRSAKRQVLGIIKYARNRKEDGIHRFKKHYKALVSIAKRSVHHAKNIRTQVFDKTRDTRKDILRKIERIEREYQKYLPRIEQVIHQTVRRVFLGERLKNDEKLISIHEHHLYPIKKGKRSKPVEFGQMVKIQESDGGIITDWDIYRSQPSDANTFIPSIDKHKEIFRKAPILAAGDRGCWSKENEETAKERGVKRVCIPLRGKKGKERQAFEKQRWFKKGKRFRTGSEATISILKRRCGMNKNMDKGQECMDNWVALSCIARNLWLIAHAMT
jgi:IS5 family transposase